VSELFAPSYLVLSLAMGLLLYGFLRRSEFGLVIAYAEVFIFLGAFVYPAALYGDLLSPAAEGSGFLSVSGQPGLSTLLHVTCYLTGAFAGYILADLTTGSNNASAAHLRAQRLVSNELAFFQGALGLGIAALVLYLVSVGWINAILYATSARIGDFQGIDYADQRVLFLKTIALSLTAVVCFTPSLLRKGNARLTLLVYFLFVAMLFAVSVSRMVILLNVAIPILIYLRIRSATFGRFAVASALFIPLLVVFLFYGKALGLLLATYVTEGELISIEPYLSDYGTLGSFFGNFEYIWYSIEGGVDHFFHNGAPLVPKDVLLSFIGFVPSKVFGYLGLGYLDYRQVDMPLACINASYFGFDCTIPPRDLGFAAYVFPLGGALCLGFIKYFIYRRQEKYFIYIAAKNYDQTWYPILTVLILTMIFSFIPSVISHLLFMLILFSIALLLIRLLRTACRGNRYQTVA